MRWAVRTLVAVAFFGGTLSVSLEARADVVFDETAQQAFGIDADGNIVDSGPLTLMWRAFTSQEEGRRILEKLEESDVDVVIEVLPEDQVDDGEAWGTTAAVEFDDDWRPTKIEIQISELPKGAILGADTIHHEMRHAEIKIDGGGIEFERARHDQMHAGRDALNDRFQLQLDDWTESRRVRNPLLDAETPIYDSIKARADDDQRLSYIAEDLGALFDITETGPPVEFVFDEGALADLEYVTGVRIAIETEIDPEAGSLGGGCGRTEYDKTLICPDEAADLDGEDVLGIGLQFDGVVPLDSSKLDIRLNLDTDGDSANDRPGEDVEDPEQGTDTTIGASYEPGEGWIMWATGPDGAYTSGSRLFVESDALSFLIPMSEVPGGGDAGFRVVVDQTHPDGRVSRDVSGISPSDPLASVPAGSTPAGCGGEVLGPPCGSQAHLNATAVHGHVDSSGSLWLEISYESPWAMAPAVDLPSTAVFASILQDGVAVAGAQWSIHDGTTFGIAGNGENVTELEMYLSPWGTMFVRIPGAGMPDGYQLGDGVSVRVQTRHQLELDVETFDRVSDFPLTAARTMSGFAGPGADWTAVVPEVGPVTLEIPSG